MFAARRDLRDEMSRLHEEMNRIFGRYGNGNALRGSAAFPALNAWADDDRVFVEAELPGFELSDLEIYVTGANQLSLKGERKKPDLGEQAQWHRQERSYGVFSRVFDLPAEVDPDKVEAHFKNGVLQLTLPKREEVKPRRITVKSA